MEVEVDGCPPPTVKWLRNGREVSADARIKISRDTHRNETYNLAVDLIKYEEQGEYEVIVTNCLGTVSSKSTVTVHSKYYIQNFMYCFTEILFDNKIFPSVQFENNFQVRFL